MESDVCYEGLTDEKPSEETLIREGEDLMKICRQIYSHTPQTLEYAFDYEDTPKGYTSNLERLSHILKLYLELLLEFIELSPKVVSAFRRHSAVYTPVLSVPALAYTLWIRIKFLTSENIKNELNIITEESNRGRVSSETQTLLLSLTTCESCHLSQSVVKELVSKVEFFCSTHEITESSVLSTKDQLRTKVHDVTNWEAMKEWCNALTTDIEQLTEITDKLLNNWKKERLKEKKRYKELEEKLKTVEEKRSKTEEKSDINNFQALNDTNKKLLLDLQHNAEVIEELKNKVENYKKECQDLWDKNKKLTSELKKNNNEIQEMTKIDEDYQTSSKYVQEECVNLKTESQIEKNKVTELEAQIGGKFNEVNSSVISKYEIEMSKLNKKIEDLQNESVSQQTLLTQQQKSLEIQERQINKYRQNDLMLEEKLKSNENMAAFYNILQEDCKRLQMELGNKTKQEIILKEKIIQMERHMNNLGEECEHLKYELQKYDLSFKFQSSEE